MFVAQKRSASRLSPLSELETISNCQAVKTERHPQSRYNVAACIVILLQSIYFCNILSVRWFIIMYYLFFIAAEKQSE